VNYGMSSATPGKGYSCILGFLFRVNDSEKSVLISVGEKSFRIGALKRVIY